MGPEGLEMATSAFSEKFPPFFDGHSSYAVYCQDVELWLVLTPLDATKPLLHYLPIPKTTIHWNSKSASTSLRVTFRSSSDGSHLRQWKPTLSSSGSKTSTTRSHYLPTITMSYYLSNLKNDRTIPRSQLEQDRILHSLMLRMVTTIQQHIQNRV